MPNDNTHLNRVVSIGEVFRVADEIRAEDVSDTLHLEEMENRLFDLSRTPAEPKAGDWDGYDDGLPDWICAELGEFDTEEMEWIMDGPRAQDLIQAAIRRALSSAAPRIAGDWEGFIGTMRAERDSHLAKSSQHVHDRNMGLAMRESDAAKQYEWVINVAEKFRGETPPFAPAPLSGITGDSDKSDLPMANSVQLSEEMVELVIGKLPPANPDCQACADTESALRLALLRQQGAHQFTPTQTEESDD